MAEVRSKNLLVVAKQDPTKGERFDKEGWILRVVEWLYEKRDGTEGSSIMLEKRSLFISDNGTVMNGKAKGFTVADLKMVKENWPAIMTSMTTGIVGTVGGGKQTKAAQPAPDPEPALGTEPF